MAKIIKNVEGFMNNMQWVVFMTVVFAILIYMTIDTTRKTKIRITNMLKNSWGKVPNKELSYEEIALRLGISINTVRTQMSRALQKLRLSLKQYLPLIVGFIIMWV